MVEEGGRGKEGAVVGEGKRGKKVKEREGLKEEAGRILEKISEIVKMEREARAAKRRGTPDGDLLDIFNVGNS